MELFLCVLGMVFIIEGLPYLAFPEKLKTYMLKITTLHDSTLRGIGIAAVLTGLLLLYLGRR